MPHCICHNDMLDVSKSAFIKGNIYKYYFYNNGLNVSLDGTFMDYNGIEYIATNQPLDISMFKHYFMDVDEYRDNQINTIVSDDN